MRVIGIRLHALGLPIRTVVAPRFHAFVPLKPHPSQIVEDRLLRLARRALEIGVFDAQDKGAVLPAGEQPVEQCRSGVSNV